MVFWSQIFLSYLFSVKFFGGPAWKAQAREDVGERDGLPRARTDTREMKSTPLSPLIVEGQQYLFLHDIETLLNLREDEALRVLQVIAHSNINRNVDEVILVHRAATLNAFIANIHGMALIATTKVLGKDGSYEALTSNFWDMRLLGKSKEILASAMKHNEKFSLFCNGYYFVVKTFL